MVEKAEGRRRGFHWPPRRGADRKEGQQNSEKGSSGGMGI